MKFKKVSKRPKNWIQFVLGLSKPRAKTEQQIHYPARRPVQQTKNYQQVLNQTLSELPLAVAHSPLQ